MLIRRATACLGAGTLDPGRLGSAIATLAVVRVAEGRRLVDGVNNGQEWHVRRRRAGVLAGREAVAGTVSDTAAGTVSVTATATATAMDTVTDTVIGHGRVRDDGIIPAMAKAGLYIHVPFCTSVCPYCDFAVTIAGEERRDGYLHALEREIALAGKHGLSFDTIYFGGGTPSSLYPDQLGWILDTASRELDIASDTTLHLEINPEDVNDESTAAWRDLGFSFASVGVQSFDDETLAFLGRTHDAVTARRATELLVDAGFETVSADLIFGLQGQDSVNWERQLKTALDLGAHHLSCYQLTIHDGTVFGRRRVRGELNELAEDPQAELFLLTHEILGEAGWQGYEVSNFASSSARRSRHNQKYWDHTPYIGLGPSAHSFVGKRRWWNQRKLRLWAASLQAGNSPVEGGEELTEAELFFETVMLGLRTADGIDVEELRRRFGPDVASFDDSAIERFIGSGHLRCAGSRLFPSPKGMAVAEALVRITLL